MSENYLTRSNGILSWAEEDRPREKLLLKGKSTLSNAEIIAILLGSGTKTLSAVDLARQILNSVDNDLEQLARLSVKDLTKFKGIGEAKAISIVSALELGRRRKPGLPNKEIIKSSSDAYEILKPAMMDLSTEQFWLLLLNRANQVIKKIQISSGGVAGTVVDPKVIFKMALEHLSSSIILAHNHPSGNLKPSKNDLDITKKLCSAGETLEVKVIDHLIIANTGYFSFADEGVL